MLERAMDYTERAAADTDTLHILTSHSSDPSELIRLAGQLIGKSRQPHVLEFEHEDSSPGGRVSSPEAIEAWIRAEQARRVAFPLINLATGRDLAGIAWFSDKAMRANEGPAGYTLTFGIRLYEGYAGRGLCLPFMGAVHRLMMSAAQGRGVWLSAKEGNVRAMKKYERFGYRHSHRADGLVYMVNDDALVV